MELRHLRYFLAVAETLNFSRAAEELNMASSPLSRAIRQLEVELGGALFERGTRRVVLTPLGEALAPRAFRMLADYDELSRDMRRRASGRQEVAVGIGSIPPALTRALVHDVLHDQLPDASIRLEPMLSLDQLEALLRGRLSFGLVNQRIQDARLGYLLVLREAPAVALPAREPFISLSEVLPEHLSGLRLIVVQRSAADFTGEPGRSYEEASAGKLLVDTSILGGLAALVANGDACCFTLANPEAPWHQALAGDGVVIRPLPPSTPLADTYLAWRVDRDTSHDLGPILEAAHRRFVEPLGL